MSLKIQALIIFVINMTLLISLAQCKMRGNSIEFVQSLRQNTIDDQNIISNIKTQTPNFNMLEDGKFRDFIEQKTDLRSLKRLSITKPTSIKNVNVLDFGAKGNGKNDDTTAFKKAWDAACSSKNAVVMLVPKDKSYLLKPTTFSGPCGSKITLQILGTIVASQQRSDYKDRSWLLFEKVDNLLVGGGGTINGNGRVWWQNSCKTNPKLPCKDAPTALTFYNCKNLVVKNLNVKDAQQIQVSFEKSMNVEASSLRVTAPENSPNTDGIHVTNTQNIRISNSVIGTGDDCISIVSGSRNVLASDITCGPGHGISIGSLGKDNANDYVSGVVVNGAKFIGTSNGVRIKTWQGGSGVATNITFENIEMQNVLNPIIIDQNYCDQKGPCKAQSKAVQVKNVLYKNIKGTSASDVAIKFDCSKNVPCQQIKIEDVDLTLQGGANQNAKASCRNVKLLDLGYISPQC